MNTTEQMLFINDNGEVACGRNGHGGQYLQDQIGHRLDQRKPVKEFITIKTPRGSWVALSANRVIEELGTGCESCK